MSCAIFPFVEIKLRVPIRFSFYGFGAFSHFFHYVNQNGRRWIRRRLCRRQKQSVGLFLRRALQKRVTVHTPQQADADPCFKPNTTFSHHEKRNVKMMFLFSYENSIEIIQVIIIE